MKLPALTFSLLLSGLLMQSAQVNAQTHQISQSPDTISRIAALEALDQGKLEFAESTLQDLLKRHPRNEDILGGLGLIRLKQGKDNEAASWFRKADHVTKDGSKKWSKLIVIAEFWGLLREADGQLRQKNTAAAESKVQQALSLQPNDPDALALLGNIRAASGDQAEAERLYQQALQVNPDSANAQRALIGLLVRSKRYPEALACIQRYNEKHSDAEFASVQANILKNQAETDLQDQRGGQALKSLEMAVALAPQDSSLRYALASRYVALGLPVLATQTMQEGSTLAPQDASMFYAQARIAESLGDYQGVLDSLANVADPNMEMKASYQNALLNLRIQQAETQLAQGHRDDAARIMGLAQELAASQAPLNLQALEQVTEVWFALGSSEQGLAVLRKLANQSSFPLAAKIYYANLLNRAENDDELTDYLPQLNQQIDQQSSDAQLKKNVHDIEEAMAAREFERLLSANKIDQAKRLLTSIAASQVASSSQFVLDGKQRLAALNPEDVAIPLLRDLKQNNPDDVKCRLALANAYLNDKQTERARQELQDLLAIVKADDLPTRLAIARLLQRMEDYAGARKLVDALLQTYPDNASVCLQSGRLARAERHYDQALADYHQAETLAQRPLRIISTNTAVTTPDISKPDLLLQNLLDRSGNTITAAAKQERVLHQRELQNYQSTVQLPPASATNLAEQARQEISELAAMRKP